MQRLCANVPFLESAFLLPLLDEFGTGHEVLALGREQGNLCAAAIMTRTHVGIWQTFQPSNLPLGAWLSFSGADIADLGKSLIRARPGINMSLSITQIDPMFQQRPADASCIKTLDPISTAWVDIDQAFDTYWEGRCKNLKTNTRKQRAKLQTEGTEIRLECIAKPEFVAAAKQDYGALKSAGWKAQDGRTVHPDNAQGHFYQKTPEQFCAQGRGRIYRYQFGDKVVAMDLGIESDERIVVLKTAYDESYKLVSPSSLMRQDEFRELFADGRLKRIEFYGKVLEWHTTWTDNVRILYHLKVRRSPTLRALHGRMTHWRTALSPGRQAGGSEGMAPLVPKWWDGRHAG